MALSKVQTSPKANSSATTGTSTFASQPVVGNGIIVPITTFVATVVSVTDNRGNTYELAGTRVQGNARCTIYFCQNIIATGTPFIVTVTASASNGGITFNAIEVTGTGGSVYIDRKIDNGATSTTPSTGTTAALRTTTDAFIIALLCSTNTQASITVESVSPTWTAEQETLNSGGNTTVSETDSRVITSANGTTQSCSWTIPTSTAWSALLITFGSATDGIPGPDARLSQLPLEVATLSSVPIDLRLSQLPLEVATLVPIIPRVTQDVIEVISYTTAVPLNVTQDVIEILSASVTAPTAAETTQFFIIA